MRIKNASRFDTRELRAVFTHVRDRVRKTEGRDETMRAWKALVVFVRVKPRMKTWRLYVGGARMALHVPKSATSISVPALAAQFEWGLMVGPLGLSHVGLPDPIAVPGLDALKAQPPKQRQPASRVDRLRGDVARARAKMDEWSQEARRATQRAASWGRRLTTAERALAKALEAQAAPPASARGRRMIRLGDAS